MPDPDVFNYFFNEYARKKRSKRASTHKLFKRMFVTSFYVFSIIIAVYVFRVQWNYSEKQRLIQLESTCFDHGRAIKELLNSNVNHVKSLKGFIISINSSTHSKWPGIQKPEASKVVPCKPSVVPNVDQGIWKRYMEWTSFSRPMVSRLCFIVRVKHYDRAHFEECMGFSIKDWQTEERRRNMEEYAVVTHVGHNAEFLLSYDFNSISHYHHDMLKSASKSRLLGISPPFPLLISNASGIGIAYAVRTEPEEMAFSPNQLTEKTVGYIATAFGIETLILTVLSSTPQVSSLNIRDRIVIKLLDLTDPDFPLTLFDQSKHLNISHNEPSSPQLLREKLKNYSLMKMHDGNMNDSYLIHYFLSPLTVRFPLAFGSDRKHELICKYENNLNIPIIPFMVAFVVYSVLMVLFKIIWIGSDRFECMKYDYCRLMSLKNAAENGSLAKSLFLTMLTHEIRNPMNSLLAMIDLLMHTELSPTQIEYVKSAQSNGNSLLRLINQVLDFTKIESSQFELEPMTFNLRSLIDEILNLLSPLLEEKEGRVEMASIVQDNIPDFVYGDPVRLRQVLINLMENAIRFTEEGHVFLTVRFLISNNKIKVMDSGKIRRKKKSISSRVNLEFQHEPNHHLEYSFEKIPVGEEDEVYPPSPSSSSSPSCSHLTLSGRKTVDESNSWKALLEMEMEGLSDNVSEHYAFSNECLYETMPFMYHDEHKEQNAHLLFQVEDTGSGIPEEMKSFLFLPFQQLSESVLMLKQGAGIGLPLSQKIINLMGGNITVSSEVGVGSTFKFDAHFSIPTQPALEVRNLKPCLWNIPDVSSLFGKRVLVVDGKRVRQQVLASYLRRLHVKVDVCDNMSSAVLAIQQTILYALYQKEALEKKKKEKEKGREKEQSREKEEEYKSWISESDMRVPNREMVDGEEGEKEKGEGWDAVLVDENADGDGLGHEFGQRLIKSKEIIRAVCRGESLPSMILITWNAAEIRRKYKSLSHWFFAVVEKPIRLRQLAESLQFALNWTDEIESERNEKKNGMNKDASVKLLPRHYAMVNDLLNDKHILVVDDNVVNLKIAFEILFRFGFASVICVDNGREAIAKLRTSHSFDCVLMDLHMPNMDGFETARKIRAMEEVASKNTTISKEALKMNFQSKKSSSFSMSEAAHAKKQLPIIGMTVSLTPDTQKRCMQIGMDAVVRKPMEDSEILPVLIDILVPNSENVQFCYEQKCLGKG